MWSDNQSSIYEQFKYILTITYTFLLLVFPVVVDANTNVDLYSGTTNYTYKIETPPGTNGMGPDLSIAYNSVGGDNGWLGSGWQLIGLGSVERLGPHYSPSPNYKPLTNSPETDDTFVLSLMGKSYRLVPTDDPNIYKTERESFLHIRYTTFGWYITDKNGTEYWFGHYEGEADKVRICVPTACDHIYRWYLGRVQNTHGVYWSVTYDKDYTNGDTYPKQIVYSQGNGLPCTQDNLSQCRTIDFVLTSNPELPVSYNKGKKVLQDKALERIDINMGGNLVRSYKFSYIDARNSPDGAGSPAGASRKFLLSTIGLMGASGQYGLPLTIFSYHLNEHDSRNDTDNNYDAGQGVFWPKFNSLNISNSPVEGLGGPWDGAATPSNCTYTMDMTNDGLPDVLVGKSNNWYYYPNTGGNSFGQKVTIPNPATPLPSLCTTRTETRRFYTYRFLYTAYEHSGHSLGGDEIVVGTGFSADVYQRVEKVEETIRPVGDTAVIDMNSDGLPDIIYSPGVGQWYWWKGLPDGTFADRATINPGTSSPAIKLDDVNIRVTDMDTDGFPDLVRMVRVSGTCENADSTWRLDIYRNLGLDDAGNLRFNATAMSTGNLAIHANDPGATPDSCQNAPPLSSSALAFVDMNGDRLLDLVWFARGQSKVAGGKTFTPVHVWYYPNQGNKFDSWSVAAKEVVWGDVYPIGPRMTDNVQWVDINGDGRSDLLYGRKQLIDADPYYVYWNLHGPENGIYNTKIRFGNAPAAHLERQGYMALVDMNGDGFVDLLQGNPGAYRVYTLDQSSNHQNLESIRTPYGGTISLGYDRLRSGNTVRWVTSSLNTDDGMGTTGTTNYFYEGGLYVGWPWNEFRGYSTVKVSEPSGIQGVTYFNQDDAKKGLLHRSSKGAETVFNVYETSEPLPGVTRVDLSQQKNVTTGTTGIKTIFTDYLYDDYGNPRQVTTSSDGIVTRVTTTEYTYNTNEWIVNRPSRKETRTHSETGNKISETWFDYDNLDNGAAPIYGDLTRETRWHSTGDNPVTQYAYDDYGNRIGTIDARQNICTTTGFTDKVEYDSTYQTYPVTNTNALCQDTTTTYWGINTILDASQHIGAYAVPGLLATVTDKNNVRIDSYWDEFSRAFINLVPPDTSSTTYMFYTMPSSVPSTIQIGKRNRGTLTISFKYVDGLGRTIQTKRQTADFSKWITQDIYYNSSGLTESVSAPYMTDSKYYTPRDETQPKTTTLYDGLLRPVKVSNPDGTFRITDYNLWDVYSTDEKSNTSRRRYDAFNRLVEVVEPAGGGTTTYDYDYYGVSPTSGSLGHNFQYITDVQGNLVSAPEFDTLGRKVADYDQDSSYHIYSYDVNGNMLSSMDAKAQTLTFTYDKLNRIKTKTYPDGNVITYYYDDPTPDTFRIGRLWKVTDLSGSTIFTYDERGRTVEEDKVIDGITFTQKTSYDSQDQVYSITYPDNELVNYRYDAGLMLNKVSSSSYGYDYISNMEYNAQGKVITKALGNGKTTVYDYYDEPVKGPTNYRLRNITTSGLQDLSYIYDDAGNIDSITDGLSGAMQSFGYDHLHRLTSASSTASPAFNYSYSYDSIGNMLSGEGKTFIYPQPGYMRPHTPVSSSECSSFTYENTGNLLSSVCNGTRKGYKWDYDNRLTRVISGRNALGRLYVYDYTGRRVKRVEGRTTTLIPFPGYRTINGVATKYYFANGKRIAERTGGDLTVSPKVEGNLYYYHPDHLGSSNVVSDSSGTQVKTTQFYPFGATRTETGNISLEQKYNGQDYDQLTGMYNYGTRYYDTNLMQFISADSIIPNRSDPQMFNRYAYVRNNPVRLTDPDGRAPVECAACYAAPDVGTVTTVFNFPYYFIPAGAQIVFYPRGQYVSFLTTGSSFAIGKKPSLVYSPTSAYKNAEPTEGWSIRGSAAGSFGWSENNARFGASFLWNTEDGNFSWGLSPQVSGGVMGANQPPLPRSQGIKWSIGEGYYMNSVPMTPDACLSGICHGVDYQASFYPGITFAQGGMSTSSCSVAGCTDWNGVVPTGLSSYDFIGDWQSYSYDYGNSGGYGYDYVSDPDMTCDFGGTNC